MSVLDLSKVSAKSSTVSDTVKKSKASHVYIHVENRQQRTSQKSRMYGGGGLGSCQTYPSEKRDTKESPLATVQHSDQADRVRRFRHGRLQRRDARSHILRDRHAMMRRVDIGIILVGVVRRRQAFILSGCRHCSSISASLRSEQGDFCLCDFRCSKKKTQRIETRGGRSYLNESGAERNTARQWKWGWKSSSLL